MAQKKPPKYEDSPADRRADAKFAKKAGKSVKDYEGSPADRKRDAAGQKAVDRAIVGRYGKGGSLAKGKGK